MHIASKFRYFVPFPVILPILSTFNFFFVLFIKLICTAKTFFYPSGIAQYKMYLPELVKL